MKLCRTQLPSRAATQCGVADGRSHHRKAALERGSVLIIVLWVAFGLISVTLYFGHSMGMELRASENRTAATQADQAILGAVRYLTNLLANAEVRGQLPDIASYRSEAVPIDEATFWVIGRDDRRALNDRPAFGLVDESSKLNLNAATLDMLQELPRMTPELAAAIIDWRDTDSVPSEGGAEDDVYLRANPPYRCKNGPFESVEELRLVHGMTLEILYGEDTNQNGILDPNENDGDLLPPYDDRNGRLDPGLIEYLTVFTAAPAAGQETDSTRVDLAAGSINRDQLASFLEQRLGNVRANEILTRLGDVSAGFASLLQFYVRSGMTPDELEQVQEDLFVSASGPAVRVNVNTAPEAVLACIPGIGVENAPRLVAHRQSLPQPTQSIAWVTEILDAASLETAAPYLTGQTWLVSIDVAAVGRYGRGYRRCRFICDTSGESPRLIARRDLTGFGWALGRQVRQELLLTDYSRVRR